MATFITPLEYHSGEKLMHKLLKLDTHHRHPDNPSASYLTPQAAFLLQRAPLLAVGTLDSHSRPWTTMWGGEPGFSRNLGGSVIGVRTTVDSRHDPVLETLLKGKTEADGEVVREEGKGRMVGTLAIDLMTRKRWKIGGRLIAIALSNGREEEVEGMKGTQGEVQMVVKVNESLGQCPKYLNKKETRPVPPKAQLVSDSPQLPQEALDLLNKADVFFVTTTNADHDMDTQHRGGPPGFVRVISNSSSGASLIWPDYSGNQLYSTLGNLQITPKAGLVFPDFDTGDVLYVTGDTEILIGSNAAAVLPRSNLAVKVTLTGARFIKQGLPFRGVHPQDEYSPYNPAVRLLPSEGALLSDLKTGPITTARLLSKTVITPTINRYRFSVSPPVTYQPGQWVALDVSSELDIGYSHMRDDDPKSLNDDYVRTFTVSSTPSSDSDTEFEITIRRIGPVTDFLSRFNPRMELEIPVRGCGGDFTVRNNGDEIVPFIAGGVGITPLLGPLPYLDRSKIRLFWTLRFEDTALVTDTMGKYPDLAASTKVFFTGAPEELSEKQGQAVRELEEAGLAVQRRRLVKADLIEEDAKMWYLCAAKPLRKVLLEWLEGRHVVFEDFDY